jgi:hypothetical protein
MGNISNGNIDGRKSEYRNVEQIKKGKLKKPNPVITKVKYVINTHCFITLNEYKTPVGWSRVVIIIELSLAFLELEFFPSVQFDKSVTPGFSISQGSISDKKNTTRKTTESQ